MENNQKSFSDFITDKDGEYSKARFMATAKALLEEGRRPDRVFRSMLYAAYASSLEHSTGAHYEFIRFAAEEVPQYKNFFEEEVDKLIAKEKAD